MYLGYEMFHDWGQKKIHHSSMYYGAAAGEPFVRAFHVWCIYMHRACTCINVHVHTHLNRTDVRYKYFRTVSELNRTEPNLGVYLQHYHPALYVRAVFLRLYF